MIFLGKFRLIDNLITACDYDFVINAIEKAIRKRRKLLISPIASHTLVRAHYDKNLKTILNGFDYLLPDSQWVRWSILFLYGKRGGLDDRVYGPELMLKVCHVSSEKKYRIFLYGNTKTVLNKLKVELQKSCMTIEISGEEPSVFRDLTKEEWKGLVQKIEKTNSNIVFISLGSPKQETFSYQLLKKFHKPIVIVPAGAAFDFISKHKAQAPQFIQNIGFEWLFRLITEPRRLTGRYIKFNFLYLFLIIKQKLTKNI